MKFVLVKFTTMPKRIDVVVALDFVDKMIKKKLKQKQKQKMMMMAMAMATMLILMG